MAKVGDIGPLRPIWPHNPQDKLDPHKDPSRRKRPPASEEGDADRNDSNDDGGHIDDYA